MISGLRVVFFLGVDHLITYTIPLAVFGTRDLDPFVELAKSMSLMFSMTFLIGPFTVMIKKKLFLPTQHK